MDIEERKENTDGDRRPVFVFYAYYFSVGWRQKVLGGKNRLSFWVAEEKNQTSRY